MGTEDDEDVFNEDVLTQLATRRLLYSLHTNLYMEILCVSQDTKKNNNRTGLGIKNIIRCTRKSHVFHLS